LLKILEAGHVLGGNLVGIVGDGGRAEVERQEKEICRPGQHVLAHEVGVQRVIGRDALAVPGLDDARFLPARHGACADMRHVRAEAGKQALECLVLVAEEDELGAAAVLVDEGLVEVGVLETGIVEDEQVLREGGDGKDSRDGRAEDEVTGHDVIGIPVGDIGSLAA
jgi:hypothetical protein